MRPAFTLEKETACCGIRVVLDIDGKYRCVCGKKQEGAVKRQKAQQLKKGAGR
jgi:hypothetical protein